jgi:acetyl-CoA C-acetyltransferase
MPDREVFILSAVRTPFGPMNDGSSLDLSEQVITESARRAGVDVGRLEDVIWGAALHVGVQVSRSTGSGQQAVHFAAQAILAGDADIILAGGSEPGAGSVMKSLGSEYDQGEELANLEKLAEKWSIQRDEMDDYVYESLLRYSEAIRAGFFEGQILPVNLTDGKRLALDQESGQVTTREQLATLKPFTGDTGRITAGNKARVTPGAAALVLASAQAVGKLNLLPRARIERRVLTAGETGNDMNALVSASQLALKNAGLDLAEMDVIVVDEDSALNVLAWRRALQVDPRKVNPNGGALAHGHAQGAMGVILMTGLLHELERRAGRFGLQVMSAGHEMAIATIIERV